MWRFVSVESGVRNGGGVGCGGVGACVSFSLCLTGDVVVIYLLRCRILV